ncbi:aminotransferase class V-fold PLP-dependent enzyme [Saccharothrix deserti]|uniref:aminotransferase class V-fold PLP-dependent enzyme n=1 Tax=Saccharothrix deserti TaxID=2593674 RepID=UPI00131C1CB5|nr:aminotransferase class V-fold PLP-dependent enzyme [Saccharothrix deserti]
MERANAQFVSIPELLDRTGVLIASKIGAPAARVTPGASAGIAMATAACMVGDNLRLAERLPDTTGIPSRVLIQRRHRYKYDRMIRLAGAELVEVGNVNGTDAEELAEAVDENTAALFVPAHLDGVEGTVSLEAVADVAHERGIPVVVDAAYLNFPVDLIGSFGRRGADLTVLSAKYFGGPNTGGVLYGRQDLVDAVAGVDFTRFEAGKHLPFGRAYKLDRQLIVGVVTALVEWLEMDHDKRFADYRRLVEIVDGHLVGIDGIVTCPVSFTMDERVVPEPVNGLRVRPDEDGVAERVARRLSERDPAILVHVIDEAVIVDVECVDDDEAHLIGAGLREELSCEKQRP